MKRLPALSIFCSAVLLGSSFIAPAAEAPSLAQQAEQVLAVVREVQVQHLAIAENQAKMDAKLATIAENIRLARIYANRAGGKK
jgi:hypothetical protein